MTDLSYFEKLEAPRRAVALALHGKFAALAPQLTQRTRWGFPGFTGNKDIATVSGAGKGANAHVNLQLFMGAHLANPDGLIEGTGKHMRNVKFYTLDDVGRPGVEAIIRAAIAYDMENA